MAEDLVSAATSGDRAVTLASLRDLLAVQLVSCGGRGAAALAHELRETLRDLAGVVSPEVDDVDDLAAKRAARRSGAAS